MSDGTNNTTLSSEGMVQNQCSTITICNKWNDVLLSGAMTMKFIAGLVCALVLLAIATMLRLAL